MPAKSEAQYRLMQAAKHSPEVRKRTGISMRVAEEFTETPYHKRKKESAATSKPAAAKAAALRSLKRY